MKPCRIQKVSGKPPCVHKVKLSARMTLTRYQREKEAQRFGRSPEQCGVGSAYTIDGKPHCLNHAGQVAIKIVMGEA